jgi:propionyl-CoA synthetase
VDAETKLAKDFYLSSLRTLFVAGERCDPDTLEHFHRAVGIPLVDNWWQTETGSPIAGFVPAEIGVRSGSTALPLPGYDVRCLSAETGEELPAGHLGSLAAKLPLPPGTMQTLHQDEERFVAAYRSEFEGYHSLGDAGVIDADGCVHPRGRLCPCSLARSPAVSKRVHTPPHHLVRCHVAVTSRSWPGPMT